MIINRVDYDTDTSIYIIEQWDKLANGTIRHRRKIGSMDWEIVDEPCQCCVFLPEPQAPWPWVQE